MSLIARVALKPVEKYCVAAGENEMPGRQREKCFAACK